jgi:hypothetical protein
MTKKAWGESRAESENNIGENKTKAWRRRRHRAAYQRKRLDEAMTAAASASQTSRISAGAP